MDDGPSKGVGLVSSANSYYEWKCREVTIGDVVLQIVSKPGTPFFGESDPSTHLLAETSDGAPSGVVLNLNCGTGLVGTVAAKLNSAAQIIMTDRNFLATESAKKTMERNEIRNAEVRFYNGLADSPATSHVDLVLIRLPKGRLPALQLLWDGFKALKVGAPCYLAGGNREGIKTAAGLMEQLFGNVEIIGYRGGHRIVRSVKNKQTPADADVFQIQWLEHGEFLEFPVDIRGERFTVHSRPGTFAWDRLDEGTRLLIERMAIRPSDAVLDLGCGTGIAGMVAARIASSGHAVLLDADAEAIRSATRSVEANALRNCTILASDAGSAVKHMQFDVVVTNPPFHVGRRAEFDIANQFILDAWAILKPGGRLYLVANMHLPYEKTIRDRFGLFHIEAEHQGYKVISTVKEDQSADRR
jgi:16S rRNA (guanine1207-N2)-methyltransferase